MNTINVKSKTKYVITVNDKGETISFDPNDLSLASKIMKAFNQIEALESKIDMEVEELKKKPNQKVHGINKRELLAMEYLNNKYNESRKIMDDFLGEGACQKIFGETNYPDMWNDLFKELKPHFRKMNISVKNMQKGLISKYKSKGNEII